jgi:hypothetical protein
MKCSAATKKDGECALDVEKKFKKMMLEHAAAE